MRVADASGALSGFEALFKVVEVGLYLGLISRSTNVSNRLKKPLVRPSPLTVSLVPASWRGTKTKPSTKDAAFQRRRTRASRPFRTLLPRRGALSAAHGRRGPAERVAYLYRAAGILLVRKIRLPLRPVLEVGHEGEDLFGGPANHHVLPDRYDPGTPLTTSTAGLDQRECTASIAARQKSSFSPGTKGR